MLVLGATGPRLSSVVEASEDLPPGLLSGVKHVFNRHSAVDSCKSCSHVNRTNIMIGIGADMIDNSTTPSGASLRIDREV